MLPTRILVYEEGAKVTHLCGNCGRQIGEEKHPHCDFCGHRIWYTDEELRIRNEKHD